MPRPQFTLRALLVAIGYERADRKIWAVGLGAFLLIVSCSGLGVFVAHWVNNPGNDHYHDLAELEADFDTIHLLHASDLFTRISFSPGALWKNREIFVATRGNERASLYLKDIYGECWKVTPERLFASSAIPPTEWRHRFSGGVLSGDWEFTLTAPPGSPLPAGSTVFGRDEFSIVLDHRNRMK